MALSGRRIDNFIDLWSLVGSGGMDIWVLSTSFQKSNIGWPLQPLTERVLKFYMNFHDSTKTIFFSKHQNKVKFKNLDDTEVLNRDFPDLRTSEASMTSTASTASVASMTSTASFQKGNYRALCFRQPWHQNDLSWSLNVKWIINNSLFYAFWALFLLEAVEAMDVNFNQIQGS